MCKNLCERLLLSFKAVALTALLLNPICISSITSEGDLTGCKLASGTANPCCWVLDLIPSVCKSRETKLQEYCTLH